MEPPRDQYGRFELLTLPIDLTPRDLDTWPETRTLIDMGLEAGALADASYSVIDASRVSLYSLREEIDDRYWSYASSNMRIDLDYIDDAESFDMQQQQVPIAVYRADGTIGRDFAFPIVMGGMTVTNIDYAASTLTVTANQALRGPRASLAIIDEAPRFPAKPSRVPASLQKTRLDGRRA